MSGHELIRRLRELARTEGVALHIEAHRGKGSHQLVRFGSRCSIVPGLRKELRVGTLAQILKNLGISRDRWQET